MEPPVPIPNTEVKHCSADGSVTKGYVRVGRCQFILFLYGNKINLPNPPEGWVFLYFFIM